MTSRKRKVATFFKTFSFGPQKRSKLQGIMRNLDDELVKRKKLVEILVEVPVTSLNRDIESSHLF